MALSRSFRTVIRKAHLVLGLTTGLVVFIVALTGCLWVFQEEITSLTTEPYSFEVLDKPFITPTTAEEVAQPIFPDKHLHGILYGDVDEAVEVIFYQPEPEFYQGGYLNPYTAEILDVHNYEAGFFHFILEGHMHLWLPEEIGSQIVRWSTVIFVMMLITGLILWWPKTKSGRKKRMKFMWKPTTKWKRKNFDLHAIFGFYVSLLALLISFTGLIMAFDWFEKTVYTAIGGDRSTQFKIPNSTSHIPDTLAEVKPIDRLLPRLQAEYPEAETFEIHLPYTDSSGIYVETTYERGVYYSSDYRFYDQYTLEELETPGVYGKVEEADFADMALRSNYDVHVGAILGLPGKFIAFFSSLLVASLPVSGFMIWLGRRKKPA